MSPSGPERRPCGSSTRLEERWLKQSSLACLARTHLNLDGAEALLNVAVAEPQPETIPCFESALLYGDKDLAPSLQQPAQPVNISTEFVCAHCSTTHRIEIKVTQLEAETETPAGTRLRPNATARAGGRAG